MKEKTTFRLIYLSICALMLSCLWTSSAAELKTAAIVDASDAEAMKKWGSVGIYEFTESEAAPYIGNRKTFFGKPVGFEFEGLPKSTECKVTLTFLSDSDRTLSLDFNGADFDEQLNREKFEVQLKKGAPVKKDWMVPANKLEGGTLSMVINTLVGANSVVQRIEVATADGKELTVRARKRFEDVTGEDLEKMVMDLPRITPRPAAVHGVKTPLISLNGTWEFSAKNNGVFQPIKVPGEWTMQGFNVEKGAFALYRKKIDVPADWKGQTVRLRFDAIHSVCKITLNGREIGGHIGGFVPFEMDATEAVQPGRENTLEILVQSESPSDEFSCLSSYASHQVGGLVRKAAMFAVPPVHLASENHWTSLKKSSGEATLHYEADLTNMDTTARKATLKLSLKDRNDRTVATASENIDLPAGKKLPVSSKLSVPGAQLWTPETPYLYTLVCEVTSDGGNLYSHELKTGLREIELKGNVMLVNGFPVKLMGICRHEAHPLTGRSISPEMCRKDAELYKEANVNLVRTSHYPPSEEFLQACDELGLFVEAEAAFCWVGTYSATWTRWNHINPDYFPTFLEGNLDNLAAHRNHPSLLFWSMANESAWSHLWKKVMSVMKRHEKSRPIAFHDNYRQGVDQPDEQPDIANFHYPSEANSDSWSREKRPVFFGEYAHLQCYNRVELATDPFIQEDWSRPLQRMVDLMWDQPGCLGGAIWSGIDDVFHLPDGNLCGYGHWGPIDGWRRCKPEHHGMRMAYSPIRFFPINATPGNPVKISIQNRQNFLDLKENVIKWSAGGKTGTVKCELPPHGKGVLTLPAFKEGETVSVSVNSLQGREIAREVFSIQSEKGKKTSDKKKGGDWHMSVNSTEKSLTVSKGPALPLPVPVVFSLNGSGGTKMTNTVVPDTQIPDWTWTAAGSAAGTASFTGSGTLGQGTLELTPKENGECLVRYSIKLASDINPRQWGLVFTLPKNFDTIRWDRNSHWSWYPANDIGRPVGTAKANPVNRKLIEDPGVEPKELWKDYSNSLGSNDFRSSKADINQASLSNGASSFTVAPHKKDAPQTVRPWVDADSIRLLVAGFTTGGTDRFFNTHYSAERRPLKQGDSISSEFTIEWETAK